MNRLRELRKKKSLSLKEESEELQKNNLTITPDALAKYERGDREPKLETWEKLADFFKVSPSYLMGLTDDKEGWLDWSRNTGYSVPRIKAEIKSLEETGRLKGIDDIQKRIGLAVESLEDSAPTTTQGVINELNYKLISLKQYVDEVFLDPETKYLNEENNEAPFNQLNPNLKVRKDMNKSTYEEILKILDDTQNRIAQIKVTK